MSERLTVDELMVEARHFFDLAAANTEHDELACAMTGCSNSLAADFRGIAIGFGIEVVNGRKYLSHFSVRLMCVACADTMSASSRSVSVITKAPAYDELL